MKNHCFVIAKKKKAYFLWEKKKIIKLLLKLLPQTGKYK